ncbi:MAG: AraC family transcriptional regulator ligand-binding domain-containing protein [Pseudomonadota bacterium]
MLAFDANYASLLYEHLDAQGLNPVAVLGEPLPGRISAEHWQRMLTRAAHAGGEPAFGVRIVERLQLHHLGVVGYLLMSCANAMEVLQRALRYRVLLAGVNPLQVNIESDQVILSWPLLHGWCGQLQDEMGLATVVQLGRMLSGQHHGPTRVDFVGPSPVSLEPYERFFGCEVRFGQDMPRLVGPLSYLSMPVLGADATLCALLDAQAEVHLQQMMPLDAELQRMRQQLLQLIRDGQPRLAALAACNELSVRALQRRLAAQGSSFQNLLEETRMHLAEQYLADARLPLTDVALLLGYSDQSTFTRAFSQAKACSPRAWRQLRLS